MGRKRLHSSRGLRGKSKRNGLANIKENKGGEEMLQVPWDYHGGDPLQTMEVHSRADIHLQSVESPMPEQVDMPWREFQPVRTHAKAGFLAGLAAHREELKLKKAYPERLQPMEKTHAAAAREQLQWVGGTPAGAVHEGLYPMAGASRWSREWVWEGRGSRKELLCSIYNPHSPPSCTAWGHGGESLGRKRPEGVLIFDFFSFT